MSGHAKGVYNTAGKAGKHLYKDGSGYAREMKATEDRLGAQAKYRRQVFAAHYIKTLNGSASAKLAGFKSPGHKATRLLKEPYVQKLLNDLINDLDQDALMTQNEILFQLKKEALQVESGNQGARISALAHMAKIRGMIVDQTNVNVTAKQSVMVVPAMPSHQEWSKDAAKSQAKLKEDVRT